VQPAEKVKELAQRSFRTAGYLAVVAGLILLASGVTSGSLLLTGVNKLKDYLPNIGSAGDLVLQVVVALLTFFVGLGGLAAVVGGILLLTKHGSLGRFLIGVGGGMAIFGLLFTTAEALVTTGSSAPLFTQSFFSLYWIGAILATVSILLSRRAPETKPII
jgi:hypothetical protein